MRPPAASATSAPKGKKRVSDRSMAALEAKVKKQRRLGPKKVPEQAGPAIKFTQGGSSRSVPRVVSPLPRQRREPTPQPSARARTPPLVVVPPAATPPSAGASSSAVPLSTAPSRGAQGEPTRRPTLDDLFPRRARFLEPATGVGGAAPSVVVLEESPKGAHQAPETVAPTGPTASTAPPPSSEPSREKPARKEPARDEPARSRDAGSRALVRTEGPSEPSEGLHVAKGAQLLNVASASDSSLGSAGTMEKAWHQADACEARAAETAANLAKLEEADKVGVFISLFAILLLSW
nr:proline-rich receptor-like protein kinase PERK9 [Lolium perenne]